MPLDRDVQAQEGVLAVVLSLIAALFGSLLTYVSVCAEQHACTSAGTCYATRNSSSWSCTFKTSITPAGWQMLNVTEQSASLQSMTRGVCAPGLRQSINPTNGDLRCIRKRSYPNALLAEIGDSHSESSDLSDHRRWCGDWIDAAQITLGEELWAFFDEVDVSDDVEDVILAKGSGRLAVSDVSKFRAACRSMVASNAAGPAGQVAFEHLDGLLSGAVTSSTLDSALAGVGLLAGHVCDTPATVGLDYGSGNGAFAARVGAGAEVGTSALKEAMYSVGIDRSVRASAAAYADAMASVPASSAAAVQQDAASTIVAGSYAGTWLQNDVGSQQQFALNWDPLNTPLARFIEAFAHPAKFGGGPDNARAYLRGLAAYCSFAARSVISDELGSMPNSRAQSLKTRESRLPAAALGRLRTNPADRFVREINMSDVNAATSVTWTSLAASSLVTATRRNARSVCLTAARAVFPDAFDKLTFDILVTPRLHKRIEDMTPIVRAAASEALEAPPMDDVYFSQQLRDEARGLLESAGVRIAGAPRGTFGGIADDFVRPSIASGDGALLIMLKQARAVHLDRLRRALRGDALCQHPPLFDALERNAYMLLSGGYACVMLLPGLMVPPFADERYSDASLYSRLGFVLAHEFMHVTAANVNGWDQPAVNNLLRRYAREKQIEAIADVGAVTTIARLDLSTEDELCGHVSQLWCARKGWLDGGAVSYSSTHPDGNHRGDAACAFLRDNTIP